MTISKMISRTNRLLDAANFTYEELVEHFDSAIDEINENMWTELPLVSDGYDSYKDPEDESQGTWGEDYDYDSMPDRHQRGYICYRAAHGKLAEEEEVENLFYVYLNTATEWLNKITTTLEVNYINDKVILMNVDANMPGLSYYQTEPGYIVNPTVSAAWDATYENYYNKSGVA